MQGVWKEWVKVLDTLAWASRSSSATALRQHSYSKDAHCIKTTGWKNYKLYKPYNKGSKVIEFIVDKAESKTVKTLKNISNNDKSIHQKEYQMLVHQPSL